MNGIIWLWKHRHCWEQLRYLYTHRYELKRILGRIQIHPDSPEGVENILARLREFDRIPLARPWKVSPPPAPPFPGSRGRIERALVLPTTDDGSPSLFEEMLDPAKEIHLSRHGITWPPPPLTKRLEHVMPRWSIDAGID